MFKAHGLRHDLSHLRVCLPPFRVSVLRKTTPEIFRLPDVDQLPRFVIEAIDAGTTRKSVEKRFPESSIESLQAPRRG
jgi:hypothetical protein